MNKQNTSDKTAPVGRRPRGGTDSVSRERLLDTAIDLFAERGIANTTVAQIGAAGKVTSAMVHYWFDTRDKLLDAVVEERVAPLMGRIWSPADPERSTALELVQGLLSRILEVTEDATWLPSLWLREIIQEGGLLRERVHARIPRDRNAAFWQSIAEAQKRGEINADISPELLFVTLLGLVMLPLAAITSRHRVYPGSTIDRKQFERHITAMLLHGLTGAANLGGASSRKAEQ